MLEALADAGKPAAGLSVDALIIRRRALLSALDDLDTELVRRGVRPVCRPSGAPRTISLLVATALSDGPRSAQEIARKTGQTLHACHQMLSKLVLAGELQRVERGLYALRAS